MKKSLADVGTAEEVQGLVGNFYPDVLATLEGNQAFVWDIGWLKQKREITATVEGVPERALLSPLACTPAKRARIDIIMVISATRHFLQRVFYPQLPSLVAAESNNNNNKNNNKNHNGSEKECFQQI